MKHFFALLCLLLFIKSDPLKAQTVDDNAGRTYYYYDEKTHKKVKEIYHHIQVIKIIPDPKHYGSYVDTFMYVKNGPYTRYNENGTLDCSGYFKQEKRDSIWKYYDDRGTIIKVERYRQGQIIR